MNTKYTRLRTRFIEFSFQTGSEFLMFSEASKSVGRSLSQCQIEVHWRRARSKNVQNLSPPVHGRGDPMDGSQVPGKPKPIVDGTHHRCCLGPSVSHIPGRIGRLSM